MINLRRTEHDEQTAVIEWSFVHIVEYRELDLLHAIPNGAMLGGGRIGAIRMNHLKAEGLRPGVCDLFLPSAHGGYFGLYIEMKTTGGKISDNQKEFMLAVEEQGFRTAVCWDAEEAIDILSDYLKQPKTKAMSGELLF